MKQHIINFFKEMFSPNGNISSMRVGLFCVIVYAGYLVLCMGIYLLKKIWEGNGVIDWTGMSLLLGAIGIFISPVLIAKANQKKHEN